MRCWLCNQTCTRRLSQKSPTYWPAEVGAGRLRRGLQKPDTALVGSRSIRGSLWPRSIIGGEGFRNVPEEGANFSIMDVKLEDVEGPFSLAFTAHLTLSKLIRSNQDAEKPCYLGDRLHLASSIKH